jgi:hypothetical protein
MTFQEFVSQARTAHAKPLKFVVLDEPVAITADCAHRYREPTRNFAVIAMAVTAPKSRRPSLVALGVIGAFPAYRIVALNRHFGGEHQYDDPEKGWTITPGVISHDWVRAWLMNHPYELLRLALYSACPSRADKKWLADRFGPRAVYGVFFW